MLRKYQIDAVEAALSESLPCLVVIPTGGGKSLIISEIINRLPDQTVLVLAHVQELVSQNQAEHGQGAIFSAGLKSKQIDRVTFASIQSIAKKLVSFDVVIIDEAHLISQKESAQYVKFLAQCQPKKIVGLSATPYRLDTGWLHHGPDAIFKKIAFEVGVQKLIDEGFLCNLTTKSGSITIDTAGVKKRGGEFIAGELQKKAMDGSNTPLAVLDLCRRGQDRKSWIVFATGVDHANQINDHLISSGILSAVITGESPDRVELLADFKSGKIRCLVTVNVLTTGFNHPPIDLIAMMRPTESVGLYVQSVGRGMRVSPGKSDCLILDYAGNVMRHGPIDSVKPLDKKTINPDELAIAPCKVCPDCQSIILIQKMTCPDCGYIFPKPPEKIDRIAAENAILKAQVVPVWVDIIKMTAASYRGKSGKETIRIDYKTGILTISEWQLPGNYFYNAFCAQLGIKTPPKTVKDFLTCAFKMPSKIKIIQKGKYYEVLERLC